MRLLIAAVGKLKQGPERELCAHYLGRAEALGRNLGLSPISVVDLAESRVQDAPGRRSAEAEALLTKLPEALPLFVWTRAARCFRARPSRTNWRRAGTMPGPRGLPSCSAAPTGSDKGSSTARACRCRSGP